MPQVCLQFVIVVFPDQTQLIMDSFAVSGLIWIQPVNLRVFPKFFFFNVKIYLNAKVSQLIRGQFLRWSGVHSNASRLTFCLFINQE